MSSETDEAMQRVIAEVAWHPATLADARLIADRLSKLEAVAKAAKAQNHNGPGFIGGCRSCGTVYWPCWMAECLAALSADTPDPLAP